MHDVYLYNLYGCRKQRAGGELFKQMETHQLARYSPNISKSEKWSTGHVYFQRVAKGNTPIVLVHTIYVQGQVLQGNGEIEKEN